MIRLIALAALLTVGIVGGVLAAFDRDVDPFTGEQQSTWERVEELI